MRWLVAVLACASVAHADPDQAKRLFEEGRALAKAGHYAEACDRFTKSYAIDPETGTEVNLADCLEKQGKLDEAYRLFDHAAVESLRAGNASRAKFARDRADAIAKKLPANPNPTPNPSPLPNPSPTPTPTPSPNPETVSQNPNPPAEPPAATPPPIPTPAAAAQTTTSARTEVPTDRTREVAVHRFHIMLGCGVGLGLAGIGAGYYASLTWHDAANRHDVKAANSALQVADVGTALGIASVASLAVAGYLYLTLPESSVAIGVGPNSVSFGGRF